MPLKTPEETPRTLWAGIGTIIAIAGSTRLFIQLASSLGSAQSVELLTRLGDPFFFALYGCFTTVLLHHVTHHPRSSPKTALQILLAVITLWFLTLGGIIIGAMILGVILGLAWLHWFHGMDVEKGRGK